MKTYEEMAKDLFKRRDEYFKKKKRRRTVLNMISMLVLCACILSTLSVLSIQKTDQADTLNSTDESIVESTNESGNESPPTIIMGWERGFLDKNYFTQFGIDYQQYDISAYPSTISPTLAVFMEHYKDENTKFWVSAYKIRYEVVIGEYAESYDNIEELLKKQYYEYLDNLAEDENAITFEEFINSKKSEYPEYFENAQTTDEYTEKTVPVASEYDQSLNLNALMTKDEIFALADMLDVSENVRICLSYDHKDKRLKYLSLTTYLQYMNAKDTDYIPLEMLSHQKLGDENCLNGVSWEEFLAPAEALVKKFPVSTLTDTKGYVGISLSYKNKVTKPENSCLELKYGDIILTGSAGQGGLYFKYNGSSFLYSRAWEENSPSYERSNPELFKFEQPADAVRASIQYELDHWNPGTVGYVYAGVTVSKVVVINMVLTKAQITELMDTLDYTELPGTLYTDYGEFDKEIREKCIPEYYWRDPFHSPDTMPIIN